MMTRSSASIVGLLVMVLASACGDDAQPPAGSDSGAKTTPDSAPPAADVGTADTTADAGPPPLSSKYTRAAFRYRLTYEKGLSCASLCAREKGKCADASSEKQGDYATCWGKSSYFIPRAWYEIGKNSTSRQLECADEAPETVKSGLFGTTVYDFVQFECCCLMRETQWLQNDVKAPKSCSEVCKARGLECGSHDRCWDIPSLCSKSFPEFMVQSMASYSEDAKGKGKLTFPGCDEVPATQRLQSHRCVCL